MAIIYTAAPRASSVRHSVNVPVERPRDSRERIVRSRRPGPVRPPGAPARYRGTGVAVSVVAHRRRPVTLATTVGLAVLAGVITLWLGLVAHIGEMANGESTTSAAHIPDRLAVVRVEPGESLQDVAARVAPDAPAPQVVQRIRELNDLGSPALVAGQTLIAPVG